MAAIKHSLAEVMVFPDAAVEATCNSVPGAKVADFLPRMLEEAVSNSNVATSQAA